MLIRFALRAERKKPSRCNRRPHREGCAVWSQRFCALSDSQNRHAVSSVSRHSWKFRPPSVGRDYKIATPATPLDIDEIRLIATLRLLFARQGEKKGGVENRRSGVSRPVAHNAAFARVASVRLGMALFPVPAHRTEQARFAHSALGESVTRSPTEN